MIKCFFSIEELKKAGFSHYKINQMVEEGTLLRLNKRFYENKKYQGDESDFYYVSAYAPKGVVCLMSATAYYNPTTYRPGAVDVAIQRKSKISTMPDWPTLSVYYYADERFETGIRNVQEGKKQFRIYDIENTVVDIVFLGKRLESKKLKRSL